MPHCSYSRRTSPEEKREDPRWKDLGSRATHEREKMYEFYRQGYLDGYAAAAEESSATP